MNNSFSFMVLSFQADVLAAAGVCAVPPCTVLNIGSNVIVIIYRLSVISAAKYRLYRVPEHIGYHDRVRAHDTGYCVRAPRKPASRLAAFYPAFYQLPAADVSGTTGFLPSTTCEMRSFAVLTVLSSGTMTYAYSPPSE